VIHRALSGREARALRRSRAARFPIGGSQLSETAAASAPARRVRPGDPGWPSVASWEELNREVGGRLITVQSPLAECQNAPASDACREVFRKSDTAFRSLTARTISFYHDRLFNRQWGEQIVFERDNSIRIAMVFQGLDRQQATSAWRPFLDWQ
jgi:hypothetical protein